MRPLIVATVVLLLAACGSDDASSADGTRSHPDIVDARAERQDDGTWRFDVTVSSPYDSPQRYADAWRILDPDGRVLGVRELAHHHAGEQPFTRSLSGVDIPESVGTVTVQGRDQSNGWGGGIFELTLVGSG